MNHKALKLLSEHDAILSNTKNKQYLHHIIRFNEDDKFKSEPVDIAVLAKGSKFVSSLNAYYVSNDGQDSLTPVELTLIPTKQNNASQEPNFITVVNDKSGEEKLKEMSYIVSHDYLTKIHNMVYLSEHLDKKLANPQGDYSLAIIDLNNFRMVNDTGGHRAGDQLLKLIAETIPKSLGPHDLLARVAGVKFAILFNLNQEDSVQQAYKIIADLKRLNFTYNDNPIAISCCIGITGIRKTDKQTKTVIKRANEVCRQVRGSDECSVLTDENLAEYAREAEVA